MKTLVYINGRVLDGNEARISPLDLSVLRGYGVMDYLRTYGRCPFMLREHLERFLASAVEIGMEMPHSLFELEEIVYKLLDKAPFDEVSLKFVLTGGLSEDQLMPGGSSTFFAVAYPFKPFAEKYFQEGGRIITREFQRPFPKAKTTQYLPAILALREAEKTGAIDVLFHDSNGWIRETGTANFFAIIDGKIVTPKTGILEGITRKVVLDLAPVEEREIHIDEMKSFEGVFLASSNKEIMPIISINNFEMKNCVIPLVIRNLMTAFANHTKLYKKNLLRNI